MDELCFEYLMVTDQIERLQQTMSMIQGGDFEIYLEECLDEACDYLKSVSIKMDYTFINWGIN